MCLFHRDQVFFSHIKNVEIMHIFFDFLKINICSLQLFLFFTVLFIVPKINVFIKSVGNYLNLSPPNIKIYSLCTHSFYIATINFIKCPFSSMRWKSPPVLHIPSLLGFSETCFLSLLYPPKHPLPWLKSTNW